MGRIQNRLITKSWPYRICHTKGLQTLRLKAPERLVDRKIKNAILMTWVLSNVQYANRECRSTETALHHLMSKLVYMKDKGYALATFLDIEGAFVCTNYVIGNVMSRRGTIIVSIVLDTGIIDTEHAGWRILTARHYRRHFYKMWNIWCNFPLFV